MQNNENLRLLQAVASLNDQVGMLLAACELMAGKLFAAEDRITILEAQIEKFRKEFEHISLTN